MRIVVLSQHQLKQPQLISMVKALQIQFISIIIANATQLEHKLGSTPIQIETTVNHLMKSIQIQLKMELLFLV